MNTATPSKPKKQPVPGRAWALSGFVLGSLVSVGGNLQAAWLPADKPGTPNDWAPSFPSQVFAVVWPLALLVSVEVLSRISWPNGAGWKLVRIGGILLVAVGSAVISYGHIYAVLTAWGYEKHQAIVGPLVIDGLMLISGFALVAIGRAARAAADIAQATGIESPAASPAEPVHTDSAHRPHTASPAGDEPHAVSPTTPHDAVGETAPEPSPARTARPIRAIARPVARRPAGRPVTTSPAGDLTDDDVIARLRAERGPSGDLPTESWMRKNFGIGQSRAARLRKEAARPDVHIVKEQEASVG